MTNDDSAVIVQDTPPHHTRLSDVAVIRLTDRYYGMANIHLSTVRRVLQKTARKTSAVRLTVDLTQVTFAGAEFVGILAETAGILRHRGRRLTLETVPPCKAVLDLCGFRNIESVELSPDRRSSMTHHGKETGIVITQGALRPLRE